MTTSNGTKVHIANLHDAIVRVEKSIIDFRTEVITMVDKQDEKIKENSKVRYRVKIYDYLVPLLFGVIGYLANALV